MLGHLRGLPGLVGALGIMMGLGACATQVADPTEDNALNAASQTEACHGNVDVKSDHRFHRSVTTAYFTGTDGKPVRYRKYEHVGSDRATVVYLNGRSEFIDKYDVMFSGLHAFPVGNVPANQTLADLPVTFIAIDHAGQGGSSDGRVRSHIDNFDTFVDDINLLFQSIPELHHHHQPVFLMAHSMGGMIASRYAQKFPGTIDGLMLGSPMLGFLGAGGLSADQVKGIAGFYALPAPNGMGMPKLCTSPTGVDVAALAAIAGCHQDPTLMSCFYNPAQPMCGALTQCLLYGLPNNCGLPAIDFSALNGALQYLKTLPDGCPDKPMTCPDPTLTTDDAYCAYTASNPLHGPEATFGWLLQSYLAQGTFAAGAPVTVPTLILSDPKDQVVDATKHTCSMFTGDCTVTQYPDYGHELFATSDRKDPISRVRAFIKKHW